MQSRTNLLVGQRLAQSRLSWLLVLALGLGLLTWQVGPQPAQGAPAYRAYADAGMAALQGWYNTTNGQWNTTGWWNSANVLEALIDHARRTGSTAHRSAISNTYDRNASGNFLNHYYDDEGWWALTWIKAYDLTGEVRYLNMAKTIFNDMKLGWTGTCGGGIWWNKDNAYKNAIANELFLSVAIRLHQRTPGDGGAGSYRDWADRTWNWFSASGMINSQNMVNDGLTSACVNNGSTTWTYNQGVILGGLADMYKVTGNAAYLSRAQQIADAAIVRLIDTNGVLREPCEPNCGADGPQFKGIFMRNLIYLYETQNRASYRDFIIKNADSIWQRSRNAANQFGLAWSGPFDAANAANQSSAQDALNAAIPFGGPNMALNAPSTTSATCSAGESGAQALDGNLATKWCAPAGSQYWLQIDLGSSRSISQFVVKHAGAGGENSAWNTRDFRIETSADAVTWSAAVNVTANTASTTIHNITTRSARYVRLFITNAQTDPSFVAARIYEFEIYSPASGSTPPTGPVCFYTDIDYTGSSFCSGVGSFGDVPSGWNDLASSVQVQSGYRVELFSDGGLTGSVVTLTANEPWLGNRAFNDMMSSYRISTVGPTATRTRTRTNTAVAATATRTRTATSGVPSGSNIALNRPASGSASCNTTTETPAQAFDGSTTTKFCSGVAGTKVLQVDLGSSATINGFMVKHAGAGGENAAWNTRDFTIETSADNVNWSNAVNMTGNTANQTTHTIASRSARYVRMSIITPTSNGDLAARIYELEVYGSVAPTATRTRTNTATGPTATRTRTNTPGGPSATRTRTRTNTTTSGNPAWAPNTAYAVGARVSYAGLNYQCLQGHTSLVGWEPPNAPSLWQRI